MPPPPPSAAYFDGRGLAEVTRLLFAASGTAFEDNRLPFSFADGKMLRPEFDALKASGALPVGQVPILEAGSVKVWQSKAIQRYVATKTGLMGSTPEEAAVVDAVCETIVEMRDAVTAAKDDAAKAALLETKLPELIAHLERAIGGDGYAANGKLSLADVLLYHFAHYANAANAFGPGLPAAGALVAAAPKAAKILAVVAANKGVAAWEAGRAARGEQF